MCMCSCSDAALCEHQTFHVPRYHLIACWPQAIMELSLQPLKLKPKLRPTIHTCLHDCHAYMHAPPCMQAIMEAAISSSLSHPNIVQTYTYKIKWVQCSGSMQECN